MPNNAATKSMNIAVKSKKAPLNILLKEAQYVQTLKVYCQISDTQTSPRTRQHKTKSLFQ